MNATSSVRRADVAPPPAGWALPANLLDRSWEAVAPLGPFTLADGSQIARQQTMVRICADAHALYARFDCVDDDIWATYGRRDDPLYEEEVVELFLGVGADDPVHYAELVVNPDGVLYDAWIVNRGPGKVEVDRAWDCPGIRCDAVRDDAGQRWSVALAVPWHAVSPDGQPSACRANFYRIDRPRDGSPVEFGCWSPTLTSPADFHRPARFGSLSLAASHAPSISASS